MVHIIGDAGDPSSMDYLFQHLGVETACLHVLKQLRHLTKFLCFFHYCPHSALLLLLPTTIILSIYAQKTNESNTNRY